MVLLYLRAQSWHGSMQYGADSPILHHMHAVVRMVSISLCCTYIHALLAVGHRRLVVLSSVCFSSVIL